MKTIILEIIFLYAAQAYICGIINLINYSRFPRSIVDFLKLTFLPYLVFNLKKVRNKY